MSWPAITRSFEMLHVLLRVLTIASLSGIPPAALAAEPCSEADRQSLIANWDRNHTKLETARADFQQLFLMHSDLVSLSRTNVLLLLERHRDFSDPNSRQAIADALCSSETPNENRRWLSQHALARGKEYYLAGRERYRSIANGSDVSSLSGQVDIHDIGISNVFLYTIGDLRRLTPKGFIEEAQLQHGTDNQCALTRRSDARDKLYERVIDPATGFTYVYRDSDANGNVTEEVLQFEPTSFGDGIVYPQKRVHCKYINGELNYFDATLLENASFNQPISDDEFSVPVTKDQTLVDHRGIIDRRNERAKSYTVKEENSDAIVAAALLEASRKARTPWQDKTETLSQNPIKTTGRISMEFVAANIVVIVTILAFVLWKGRTLGRKQ